MSFDVVQKLEAKVMMMSFPCLPSLSTTPAFSLTNKLCDYHYQKLSCCVLGNASTAAAVLQQQIRSESSPVPIANSSSMTPDFKHVPMANNNTKANDWKSKGTPQLKRWSRVRNIRPGRRLDRPVQDKVETPESPASPSSSTSTTTTTNKNFTNNGIPSIPNRTDEYEGSDDEDNRDSPSRKAIYMVSDGTGWTAEHSVNAALGQFETCLVDGGCGVNTHLFSGIDEIDRLLEIIRQAAKEEALLLYTLADPNMAEVAKRACQLWGVPYTDILGPTTEAIAVHLGVAPSGVPRGSPTRNTPLSKRYFKRIEAVEFTIKQDDGALPNNLHKADLVLVGVSRTSKTPLSTYLAQKEYKVANVPLVLGIDPPKELFEIDQDKIYGLIISPAILQSIRLARAKTLGLHYSTTNYSEMDHIRQELEYASKLFAQNPRWPVIDVTGKAIEETAAVIVRIYHEKTEKYGMPRISKRY